MRTRRPLSAMAAILVAAVVLSACGHGVAGDTPPGRDTGSEKAAVVEPAYVDVTGQGRELPRDDVDRAQFSATAVPGAQILAWGRDGKADKGSMCTLGPAVTVGGRPAILTAGHCETEPAGGTHHLVTAARGAGDPYAPLGPLARVIDEKDSPGVDGILDDRALIFTDAAASASSIAGFPVAASLTLEQTRALPAGTPICVDGARSGVRCGGLVSASGDRIVFEGKRDAVAPNKGDSGAPVFVVDEKGRATVVGLVTSEAPDGSTTNATFIEPTLRAFDATLATAP